MKHYWRRDLYRDVRFTSGASPHSSRPGSTGSQPRLGTRVFAKEADRIRRCIQAPRSVARCRPRLRFTDHVKINAVPAAMECSASAISLRGRLLLRPALSLTDHHSFLICFICPAPPSLLPSPTGNSHPGFAQKTNGIEVAYQPLCRERHPDVEAMQSLDAEGIRFRKLTSFQLKVGLYSSYPG